MFNTYTGNAFFNNALQTIEALANLGVVSQITPEILLSLYKEPVKGYSLIDLNKKFKSYTMIFSLNNPLVNPAKKPDNLGEKVYDGLMQSIIKNCETEGSKVCEISGLRYEKTFEYFYDQEVKKLKEKVLAKKLDPKKEKSELANLDNTDTSINRCWFPLVGGLGSDAQALPQAKFAINVHPICLVIMQFLPLSALLYKGKVLLIDSVNFNFTREFIDSHVQIVKDKIELSRQADCIENIKEFGKGDYILKGLELFDSKKEYYEDSYSDLNLWSFSNSGTGASCEIDRIPNKLFQKLRRIRSNPSCKNELVAILKGKGSYAFLECLKDNIDFYLLYPAKNYSGVSIDFFEAYQHEINNTANIEYGKYIAGLISKFEVKGDEKLLGKTDAYKEPDYRTLVNTILVKATEKGLWTLNNHLEILNDKQTLPVNSSIFNIHKIIHFYFQKNHFSDKIPHPTSIASNASNVCSLIIDLINIDEKSQVYKKDLIDSHKYQNFSFNSLLIRAVSKLNLDMIQSFLYKDYQISKYGILDLLRIYYSQPVPTSLELNQIEIDENPNLKKYVDFASDYLEYYLSKYTNQETGLIPYSKFEKHVLKSFPKENRIFIYWLNDTLQNRKEWAEENNIQLEREWDAEELLLPDNINKQISFSRFAIQFELNKAYYTKLVEQL